MVGKIMKKIIPKFLILLTMIGMFSVTHLPNVEGRNIGSLNGIYIYNGSYSYTDLLEKTVWNGWYVVNLGGTTSYSRVRSMLVNSNGDKRSEWNLTDGGTRDNYYTINCQSGYLYRLMLENANVGADDIYGTWSPDHY